MMDTNERRKDAARSHDEREVSIVPVSIDCNYRYSTRSCCTVYRVPGTAHSCIIHLTL
jgi:hypothetical protein